MTDNPLPDWDDTSWPRDEIGRLLVGRKEPNVFVFKDALGLWRETVTGNIVHPQPIVLGVATNDNMILVEVGMEPDRTNPVPVSATKATLRLLNIKQAELDVECDAPAIVRREE